MTHHSSGKAAQSHPETAATPTWNSTAGLPDLQTEMQALIAMMPGATFAGDAPLPNEEEVEAMFDNMPV
jgi:hypothetical protein